VYGWSRILENGELIIPPEAVEECHLEPKERVILASGSKTSGGFMGARKSTTQLRLLLKRLKSMVLRRGAICHLNEVATLASGLRLKVPSLKRLRGILRSRSFE
jgi:hypothetical protein